MPRLCSQVGCDAAPLFAFHWPGQPEALVCDVHAKCVGSIAESLGVDLDMHPVCSLCCRRATGFFAVNKGMYELAMQGLCYDGAWAHCPKHGDWALEYAKARLAEVREIEAQRMLQALKNPYTVVDDSGR